MKMANTERAIAVLSLKFTVEVSRMGEATNSAQERIQRNFKRSPEGRSGRKRKSICERGDVDCEASEGGVFGAGLTGIELEGCGE